MIVPKQFTGVVRVAFAPPTHAYQTGIYPGGCTVSNSCGVSCSGDRCTTTNVGVSCTKISSCGTNCTDTITRNVTCPAT